MIEHCLDLSKAFDIVVYGMFYHKLSDIGFSDHTVHWFYNFHLGPRQCVKYNGLTYEIFIYTYIYTVIHTYTHSDSHTQMVRISNPNLEGKVIDIIDAR